MAATRTEISASAALQFFKGGKITVQEAKPVKIKGYDGKIRDGMDVKAVSLNEAHVTGAADYRDKVVITTIDGRRYEANKRGGADKQ